jgi:hypothetical protein
VNWDAVTVRSTTSGAEKSCELSIWMRYEVAALTSVQSKATGCGGAASCAGLRSVGAEGVGGGATAVVDQHRQEMPGSTDAQEDVGLTVAVDVRRDDRDSTEAFLSSHIQGD